jgi:hypothetical protein
MIDAVAEIGDQLQLVAGLHQHRLVDAVGDRRHQHLGLLDGGDELGLAHRVVVLVEPGVEQLAHPRLDHVGQLAGDDDERLACRHGAPRTPKTMVPRRPLRTC